ncbi:MAG: hypothetical protein L3J18_14655 [Candidatus Brocadia sp.]|nr:MAG: hypothetical protein L3J18_14655 [Candidatus Brocadia sp.]
MWLEKRIHEYRDDIPEVSVIRPPSEWRNLLVRITKGCKWDRCRFCGIYPYLGESGFSVRSVAEIERDIDLLRSYYPNPTFAIRGVCNRLSQENQGVMQKGRHYRPTCPDA